MKKYITPAIEVIAMDTEFTLMTGSNTSLSISNETVESGLAPERRRGDAWSDYEAR